MSNVIDTSPIISMISWSNNTCTVDRTNFSVRVDPRGMAAVLTVDPDARFLERFSHMYGINSALMRAPVRGWTEQLNTLDGYREFYDYCASRLLYETASILSGVTHGFLFDVEVHKDSPLVGWFLVLGDEHGRSRDFDYR